MKGAKRELHKLQHKMTKDEGQETNCFNKKNGSIFEKLKCLRCGKPLQENRNERKTRGAKSEVLRMLLEDSNREISPGTTSFIFMPCIGTPSRTAKASSIYVRKFFAVRTHRVFIHNDKNGKVENKYSQTTCCIVAVLGIPEIAMVFEILS